jgi:hypothetical protein
VTEDDAALFDKLRVADKRKLQNHAQRDGVSAPIPTEIVNEILRMVQPTIAKLSFRKLRFIAKYDPAFDRRGGDFQNALTCEAIRILHKYERIPSEIVVQRSVVKRGGSRLRLKKAPVYEVNGVLVNGVPVPFDVKLDTVTFPPVRLVSRVEVEYVHYLKLLNYTRRSVANYVIALINRNTAKCRERIRQKDNGDYESGVVSLIDEGRIGDEGTDPEIEVGDVLTKMLTSKQLALVNIITGSPTEGFETWLRDVEQKAFTELTPTQARNLGIKYLDLSTNDVNAIKSAICEVSGSAPEVEIYRYLDAYLELDYMGELATINNYQLNLLRSEVLLYGSEVLGLDAHSLWCLGQAFDTRVREHVTYMDEIIPDFEEVDFLVKGNLPNLIPYELDPNWTPESELENG